MSAEEYIETGRLITGKNGKFMVVESEHTVTDMYYLVNVTEGTLVAKSHDINVFRNLIGEIKSIKCL